MARPLYGSGLRLMECLQLRVKDVDISAKQIIVRDGKGFKDRVTILAATVVPALEEHLIRVKAVHQDFLSRVYGEVELFYALAKNIRMQNMSGVGSMCFPHILFRPIPVLVQSVDIIFMKVVYKRP